MLDRENYLGIRLEFECLYVLYFEIWGYVKRNCLIVLWKGKKIMFYRILFF